MENIIEKNWFPLAIITVVVLGGGAWYAWNKDGGAGAQNAAVDISIVNDGGEADAGFDEMYFEDEEGQFMDPEI